MVQCISTQIDNEAPIVAGFNPLVIGFIRGFVSVGKPTFPDIGMDQLAQCHGIDCLALAHKVPSRIVSPQLTIGQGRYSIAKG
jgi:hypothetical protein